MSVLVTGGAGYIGSHMVLVLLEAGHDVVVLDNLQNSRYESLKRVEQLTGQTIAFIQGDVRDRRLLDRVLRENQVDTVLHFAALKSVNASTRRPLAYFDHNIGGTITLCEAMKAAGVRSLVFSSSAAVYGPTAPMPLVENAPAGEPTNPYARSKLIVEQMLRDLGRAEPEWSIALLRYFNPVGAHASGQIGEDPLGSPENLVPYIAQVAIGRRDALAVFGDDYPTHDGTGVRDYIHVMDLAEGHLQAMHAIGRAPGVQAWNLGTGRGYSVLEMVRAFEQVSGRTIPLRIMPRRSGDIAESWADPGKAERELGWTCRHDLETMLRDTWRWQSGNPDGFR